ncbi:MAG: zinc-ribbon domain-containing protein [Candidatus Krumholzibacteriota bacterium]|nr:zinc-ribbon domain-containing protein [Candidatus Krumholzibacteriota bacterium]
MIVTCGGCQTKYMLGDEKIPNKGIRVRCPKCQFVWRLTQAAPEPVFEVSRSSFDSEPAISERQASGWAAGESKASAVIAEPEVSEMEKEFVISEPEPEKEPELRETPEQQKKRDRTKRLARVFVSDILIYNQEKRDHALSEGNLMTALGPEIKKAWEAYKEKVGTDIVESNEYFRNALNEILADGQKVF